MKPPPLRSAAMHRSSLPVFDFPPWRLSGVVVGALLNDPAALAALGEAAYQPPYRAPPRAPVLYVKPRNTFASDGARTPLPARARNLCVGASIGLVIGRAACRVPAAEAMSFVAGCTLVVDLYVPHESLYRPSVRERAFDASCVLGPRVVALDPDRATLRIRAGESSAERVADTSGLLRPAAQLIADVSEFMTLHAGDVLLLGVRHPAPTIEAGQRWSVECAPIGALHGEALAAREGDAS